MTTQLFFRKTRFNIYSFRQSRYSFQSFVLRQAQDDKRIYTSIGFKIRRQNHKHKNLQGLKSLVKTKLSQKKVQF